MSNKLIWKILTGCFLAITALVSILGSVLVVYSRVVQIYLLHFIVGLGSVGLILVLLGLVKRNKIRKSEPRPEQAEPADAANPLSFFERLEFWGAVLLVAAGPIYVFSRGHLARKEIRPPAVAHKPPPPPAPVPAAAPVKFPPLHLQGLVCNGAKSSAVIDGATVQIGEFIKGARLVAIEPAGVALEFSGATNFLKLD